MSDSRSKKRPASGPQRQWRRPEPEAHIAQHSALVASAIGAAGALLFSFISVFFLVLFSWMFAAHGDETTMHVVKASGIALMAIHAVPISVGTISISLLPWGFLFIPMYFIWKSAHWTMKSAVPEKASGYFSLTLVFSASYSVYAALVVLFSNTDASSVDVLSAMWHCFVISYVVASVATLVYAPSLDDLLANVPRLIRESVRPGVITAFLLLCVGGLGATGTLIVHHTEVSALTQLMAPNNFDAFLLTLLECAYVPTAIVWSTSYLLGPGIHLGGSGLVSVAANTPGALPAFPLLAGIPSVSADWAQYLIVIPVIIGSALYLTSRREHWTPQGVGLINSLSYVVRVRELMQFVVSLSITAVVMWGFAALGSGALGINQLSFIGPDPLAIATATITLCTIGGGAIVLLPRIVLTLVYVIRHRNDGPVSEIDTQGTDDVEIVAGAHEEILDDVALVPELVISDIQHVAVDPLDDRPTVVVLASGSGTLFQALIDAVAAGQLDVNLLALITDCECAAIGRAQAVGIRTIRISGKSRKDIDKALLKQLSALNPELIVSAGFMRIIGPKTVGAFRGKIINTHPAMLPNFPGAHAVRDALAAGATVTGSTVHYVDEGMDTGPIITQSPVNIEADDTEASLHERIKIVERELLVQTVRNLTAR